MSIAKWFSVKGLMNICNRVSRLFRDFVRGAGSKEPADLDAGNWGSAAAIYRTGNAVILKAELPGFDRKDIDLEIEGNTLRLSGERRFQEGVSRRNFYCMAGAYGKFRREFTLPGSIDIERIEADYREGVLRVFLPQSARSQRKPIKVSVS